MNYYSCQKETAEGDLTPSAFGKILSNTMGPNKFCRWLLDNNFAFRNGQGRNPERIDKAAGILSA